MSDDTQTRASLVVKALIRTLYNEDRLTLICATYGYNIATAHKDGHVYHVNEKVAVTEEAKGGWVRWLGSLDDPSVRRLADFALSRDIEMNYGEDVLELMPGYAYRRLALEDMRGEMLA